MRLLPLLTLAAIAAMTASNLHAAETELNVGDPAPAFESTNEEGQTWKSEDHVGKKVLVVYFYPADFTGGCTKQACAFRDDMADLTDEGVEVIGVSGDTAETHKLFKKHHNLNFTLLADPQGTVAKAFGVPLKDGGEVKQAIDGEERTLTRGVTAQRWTFVIGKDGKIAYKNTKVEAAKDSQAILEVVQELKKG